MPSQKELAVTVEGTPASPTTVLDAEIAAHLQQLEARERALAAREQEIKDRQRELHGLAEAIGEREAQIDAAKTKAESILADLAKRQKRVAETESSIEARARDVVQLELEASTGFAGKNREALAELTKAHVTLRAEIDRLQAELNGARLKGLESLEKWIAEERRTRTAALDVDLAEDRTRHQRQLASEVAAHDAVLAEQRQRFMEENRVALEHITRQRAELQEQEAVLQEKAAELHRGLGELRWKEEDLAGVRAGVERSIETRAREQVASLERQLEAAREDNRQKLEQVIFLESQDAASRDLLARFGDDPDAIERRLAEQALKNSELETELLRRPSASDKERLIALQKQERVWLSERDRLFQEVTQLKAEQGRWLTGVADLEQQRERREVAERRLEVLAGEMEKYKVDVDRMRALYERPEERAARVGTIEVPWRTDFKLRAGAAPKELEWIDGIVGACEASGMRFPKRLVHAFHTSLKAAELSPLTVLAGVSGTGKSELPRLYSRFGGLGFLSLAVQPNWDSPQSLFGYFNSIDNRFNATTVLRAMVQAQHAPGHETYKHGLSDRLVLVLLDEMNLAHVEQYFSDLLSRLEQRRGETRDVTLDIDLGAGLPPYPLRLGRNVLWVGTMNEDETTKALSDKVIDRSNLLFFPRPRTLHSRADVTLGAESPLLAESAWREWLQLRSPFEPNEVEPFRHGLEAINQRLEYVGRALGHRVWQSVEYYLANHPEVIDARVRKDQDALQRTMRRAYEDQLVLKVMPKLRGIETAGDAKRNCLDPIRKQLENADLGLGLAEDFDIACRVGHGAFVWNSARYLENAE